MDVILNYLENMFLNLPKTDEVKRAKGELSVMMEDKYNELIAEGKKENEAIGIVISEFGNLEELAVELGLEQVLSSASEAKEASGRYVSREEAQEYINMSGIATKRLMIGVVLCILSPVLLFWAGGLQEYGEHLTDTGVICMGLVPLFVLIAIAVSLFIYTGMKMEKFDYLKKEAFYIDGELEQWLHEFREKNKQEATIMTIIGVVLCILSVIPLLVIGSFVEDGMALVYALIALFIIVAAGVACIIYGNYKLECVKVLCQEGDYTKAHKKSAKIIDKIAGVYWTVVTAIYITWSFVSMNWGFSWIVWPIAGVIFAILVALCNAVQSEK